MGNKGRGCALPLVGGVGGRGGATKNTLSNPLTPQSAALYPSAAGDTVRTTRDGPRSTPISPPPHTRDPPRTVPGGDVK